MTPTTDGAVGSEHPTTEEPDLSAGSADPAAGRGYGATMSTPTAADIEQARITDYARWLGDTRGVRADGSYASLWRWSVTEPAGFWASIWDYFGVLGGRGDAPVPEGVPRQDDTPTRTPVITAPTTIRF